MKTIYRLCWVAVLAMVFTVGAFAQLTKGFRGVVLDRQGKPVKGATVTIINKENSLDHYEVKTDKNGRYIQAGLTYSDTGYTITVHLPGLPAVTKVRRAKMMEMIEVNFDMRSDVKVEKHKTAPANPAAEAQTLYNMGEYEEALTKANEAIITHDHTKEASYIKAAAQDKLGNTDAAIVAFKSYQKKYPGNVSVLGILSELYAKKGDKKKAAFYKKAFGAKGGKIQNATYNQGVRAYKAGEYAKAAELFKKASKDNPDEPDCHREWALALVQLGKYQETIDQLKIYLKMKPNAADAQTWKQSIVGLKAMLKQEKSKKKK